MHFETNEISNTLIMVILLKPVLGFTTKCSSHSNFEKSKCVVEKLNNYGKILVTTLQLLYQETSYSPTKKGVVLRLS